jgi:(p)ppGpp synthase/HD superfamily hydrolase
MLSSIFDDALVYSSELHREQTRKGSDTPYIAHLLATASLAIEHGATEDEAVAALLHDAAEDQGGERTLEAIRARFGATVADIVAGCSDTYLVPKPPWRERKAAFIEHLRQASQSVRFVCACDKLHNARSLVSDYQRVGDALWERFSGRREGTLWYYREVARVLTQGEQSSVVADLSDAVSQLESLGSRRSV